MAAVIQSGMYTNLLPTGYSNIINYNSSLMFNYDNIVSDSNLIYRNSNTGNLTINISGKFFISWWVAIESVSIGSSITFALNGTAKGNSTPTVSIPGVSSSADGQISGIAIVDINTNDIPYTISLTNITGIGTSNTANVTLDFTNMTVAEISIVQLIDNTAKGPVGPRGLSGIQGRRGLQGLVGTQGPIGPQGEQGPAGPTGSKGPKGDRGPQGVAGPRGSVGAQGLTGERGPTGPMGLQGLQGQTGAQGPQGVVGPQGLQGPVGPVGPVGEQGPAGQQGERGAVGPRGPQGFMGPRGQKGLDGSVNKISIVDCRVNVSGAVVIPYEGAITFNEINTNEAIVTNTLGATSSVSFDGQNITFLESGIYKLNWWLNIDSVDGVSEIDIDIVQVVNGTPNFSAPLSHDSFPVTTTGQINSMTALVITANTTINIINSSIQVNSGSGNLNLVSSVNLKGVLNIDAFTLGD